MKFRKPKVLWFLFVIIAILSFFFIIICRIPSGINKFPKDEKIIADLKNNHSYYTNLCSMIEEDRKRGLILTTDESVKNENKISGERLLLYNKQFAHLLKVYGLFADNGRVKFLMGMSGGSAIGIDHLKGLMYLPRGNEAGYPEVNNLDTESNLKTNMTYYRKIDDHWFIYYEILD